MRMRTIAVVVSLLLAAILSAAPALAAPTEEQQARALFREGNRLRDLKDYAGALDMYRAAYEKAPNPKILVNIGSMLGLLNRNVEAAETYEKFLAIPDTDPALRTEVEKALQVIDQSNVRLAFDVKDEGAVVMLDGQEIGRGPFLRVVRTTPGEHTVLVAKQGMLPSETKIKGVAGRVQPVDVKLKVRPIDEPDWSLPPTEEKPTGSVAPRPKDRVDEPPPRPAPRRPGRGLRNAGIVTGLAGVLVVGVGVYFGLEANRLAGEIEGLQPGSDEWDQGLEDSRASAARNAVIFSIVGGGAIVTGVVLYYLGVKAGREPAPVSIGPTDRGDGAAVFVTGTF
jgi:hypothetical protein